MRAILILTLVAGCGLVPVRTIEAPAMGPEDTCGANGFQPAVGRDIRNVTVPADRSVRVIGPDTAVTLDHRPDRLNFDVDKNGKVLGVHCG